MKLTKSTIGKIADAFIRVGEAGFLGGIATYFVPDFPHVFSVVGNILGLISVIIGFSINNVNKE